MPFRGAEPPEPLPGPPMSRRRRLGDTDGALGAKRRRLELPGEGPRPDGTEDTGGGGALCRGGP